MAQFFINRPIFAWVVSILIMVLGSLAITQLPVAQYPSVAPPSISVTANYAGASAETLQETEGGATLGYRSEEHTSELQSRVDIVCRLLLEKKKKFMMPDLLT